MPTLWRSCNALVVCLAPAVARGQAVAEPPHIAWRPRVPLEGSVILLGLRLPHNSGDSVVAVQGELAGRSEERRVGEECRSRGAPCHLKKKNSNAGPQRPHRRAHAAQRVVI